MQSDSGLSADVKGTDALWSVELVTADRKQIDVHLIHVDRHLANTLGSICVEEHFVLSAKGSNLF